MTYLASPPGSLWLNRFIHLIPPGEVLDLASGAGRNCPALLAAGNSVLALDRDPHSLAQAAELGAATLCHDLEQPSSVWPFEVDRFAGIVVCNYLHRPLFPFILSSLAPQGVLIIETFAQGNAQFGKPSNPEFLLAPDELLGLVTLMPNQPLHVVAYECGYVDQPKPALVQRICIKKSALADAHLARN
ncbi:class I SAM-dependent methyltransferase [Solimicrobium silvestre]|uniref:Methyltransferase domain n=1 Tax=Solimicrobium silvestre TaxID=2099400 RepID=A0A2S9GSJ0_9BURK|nr:class I SAM-dependent methyltransferase [Solimicrobium silvestre]PRC90689.1 hypothetical protein S2091_4582 [Solimicrobium silvestre]